MKNFTVTYSGQTPGRTCHIVTGVLEVQATDALHALNKASSMVEDDPEVYEAEWSTFNFDVKPTEGD